MKSENIRKVYHELFDDTVKRYNDKQTRVGRKIDDYYKKYARASKKKCFTRLLCRLGIRMIPIFKRNIIRLQVNFRWVLQRIYREKSSTSSVLGLLALGWRNTPPAYRYSVPYMTGSKRGLNTRVTLKQALAMQGFKGGSRKETEWNQWAQS